MSKKRPSYESISDPIAYNLGLFTKTERKPCDFYPSTESKSFVYLPINQDEDCRDSDLAWIYISRWENEEVNEPKAVDINNVGCAYLWIKEPDWEKAYSLFVIASRINQRKNNPIEQGEFEELPSFGVKPKPPILLQIFSQMKNIKPKLPVKAKAKKK